MNLKQITNILILMTFFLFTECGQGKIKIPDNAITKLEEFKSKEKFIPDKKLFYPGIGDPAQKSILTEKINLAAEDFENISKTGKATSKDYQNAIKIGLNRFAGIYIDSENQERICYYFQELMDIVGLDSSDGQLNNFRYGLDGIKKDKKSL